MVCRLLEADRGEVVIGGTPLTTRSVAGKAAIGYVPQELAIYPDLTARENLRFFARLYGLTPADANARAGDETGEFADFDDWLRDPQDDAEAEPHEYLVSSQPVDFQGFCESGRQDLNLRPPGPQPESMRIGQFT